MTTLRRVLGFMTVIVLVAFALPSYGAPKPNKTYEFTANVDDSEPINNTQQNTKIKFTVLNTSPTGSSGAAGYLRVDLTPSSGPSGPQITHVDAGNLLSTTSAEWSIQPPINPHETFTATLEVSGCGDNQKWTPTVTTGVNSSKETFTPTNGAFQITNVPCVVVGCGQSFTVQGAITDADAGTYALDGTTCQTSASTVYFTDYTNYLQFRWVAPNSRAFFYVVNRDLHHLAWGAGPPVFDPALTDLACDGNITVPITPVPLATVTGDTGGGQIKVDTTGFATPSTPTPTPPFYITAEWTQGQTKRSFYAHVSSISGQTWKFDSSFPQPRPSAPNGTIIMSTVNPPTPDAAVAPYIPRSMALACFVAHGATSAPAPWASIVDSDPEGNSYMQR